MPRFVPLLKGASGPLGRELQRELAARGYPVTVDGVFGSQTLRGVRAFQSQNLDPTGQPLVIDGKVGPLTWWSLHHPKPRIDLSSAVDFTRVPVSGGSRPGRVALSAAAEEITAGAGEVGGNNQGSYVRKYLHGLAPQGSSWCAGFVSWCFSQGPAGIPFPYTVGARALLGEFKRRGWAAAPGSGYAPAPGDIVVWWRERLEGWLGHIGLVHQVRDGILYTVEGNHSPRVQGFSYVLSRMEKLLGYGHVPDPS